MFPMFMRIPFKMPEYVRMLIKILAYATGVFMLRISTMPMDGHSV